MARPRLPSSLKRLRGTEKPSRVNPREPKPPPGPPPMPANLSEAAAAFWPALCELLANMRVVASTDALAMCALAEVLGDLDQARKSLEKPVKVAGRVIAKAGARVYVTQSSAGVALLRSRPEIAQIADCDRRLLAWLSRFGLTPSDRGRVSELAGLGSSNPFLRFGKPPPRIDSLDAYLNEDPDGDAFDAFMGTKPLQGPRK